MKKLLTSLIFFILVATINVNATSTLGDNELLRVKSFTITESTTIEEINQYFGNAKIVSPSVFGGNIYSYYDEDFTYYMYIETDEVGKIQSYGASGGEFVGKYHSYIDEGDNLLDSNNYVYEYRGKALGISEYVLSRSKRLKLLKKFEENDQYMFDMQKHVVAASKYLHVSNGDAFPQTSPSEDIFYTSKQLIDNNSSFEDYFWDNSRSQYGMSLARDYIAYEQSDFYVLPNPLVFAVKTFNHVYGEAYKYLLAEYNPKTTFYSLIVINPDFLKSKNIVPLTDEEQEKYRLVLEQFNQYSNYVSKIDPNHHMTIEPQVKDLPLTAGKWDTNYLLAATSYLNMARTGGGLRSLSLNEDIAEAAQYKAALTIYNANKGIISENSHMPNKPDGMEQSFYDKAQSFMTGENLFMGDLLSSIRNALNDGYGDPIRCAHRYNLLNHLFTEFGIGTLENQGVHKFSGYQNSNVDLIAWPNKGITPLDLIGGNIGNWTAYFIKDYTTTDKTFVTIKNLNTESTYTLTKENTESDNSKLLKLNDSLVTFYDNVSYDDGDIVEITIHNLNNYTKNKNEDYTYRTVFKRFYDEREIIEVEDIILDKSVIEIDLNEELRVNAKITNQATDMLMYFKSTNENIATVRADGTIKAIKPGKTTVQVQAGNIIKTIQVNVRNSQGIIPDHITGDITCDGKVDLLDVMYALRISLNLVQNVEEEIIDIGDINTSGDIDLADVMYILRIALNLV